MDSPSNVVACNSLYVVVVRRRWRTESARGSKPAKAVEILVDLRIPTGKNRSVRTIEWQRGYRFASHCASEQHRGWYPVRAWVLAGASRGARRDCSVCENYSPGVPAVSVVRHPLGCLGALNTIQCLSNFPAICVSQQDTVPRFRAIPAQGEAARSTPIESRTNFLVSCHLFT